MGWKRGMVYISDSFEIVECEACGNGNDALLGIGESLEDCLIKLDERMTKLGFGLIDTVTHKNVKYYNYMPLPGPPKTEKIAPTM